MLRLVFCVFAALCSMDKTLEEQLRFPACAEFFMENGGKRADVDGMGGAYLNAFTTDKTVLVAGGAGRLGRRQGFVRDVAFHVQLFCQSDFLPFSQAFASEQAGFLQVCLVRPSFRDGQFRRTEAVFSDECASGQRDESQGGGHVTQFDQRVLIVPQGWRESRCLSAVSCVAERRAPLFLHRRERPIRSVRHECR